MSLYVACAVAAFLSFILVDWVRRRALQRSLMDVPNERSLHTTPTPRGGGLGIVLAFVVIGLVTPFAHPNLLWPLLAGAIPIAWIGWKDDHGHVSPKTRALVHVGASAVALVLLFGKFSWALLGGPDVDRQFPFNLPFIFVVSVSIAYFLNLFNFMDGLDGLAGSEAAFAGLAAPLLLGLAITQHGVGHPFQVLSWARSVQAVAPLLGSCCLGFLLLNWPPARVFMGDVCSGFLGFVFGFLAFASSYQVHHLFWVWLILFGVFVVDGTYTLGVRFATKQRWYEAHRLHTFQKAALRANGHRVITVSVLAINLFWLLPMAALAAVNPQIAPWLTCLALAPLVAVAAFYRAGQPETPSAGSPSVAK